MVEEQTYGYSTVEAACWAVFTDGRGTSGSKVAPAFSRRCRKMTELGVPIPLEGRSGRGFSIGYTRADAFEVALALRLQDSGLKQSDVAFMLTHIRPLIRDQFAFTSANPPAGSNVIGLQDRPNNPPQILVKEHPKLDDPTRAKLADTSVFLAFRYVEVVEAMGRDGEGREPTIFAPTIHHGVADLAFEMERVAFSLNDGVRIVIELSGMAWLLNQYLDGME